MGIIDWYKKSNRYIHSNAGGLEYAMLYVQLYLTGIQSWQNAIICTEAVLITMIALEFKDKQRGGKFDWNDILAGMTWALIIDTCILLHYIIMSLI